MSRVVLAFGDSNTHGAVPLVQLDSPSRHPRGQRWPDIAQHELGPDWQVIDEGLPGRTTNFDDPVTGPMRNGLLGLHIALQSHSPIDVLVLMLGTNDVKACFGASPDRITGGMAGLLSIALDQAVQIRHGGFKILVTCPAPISETGVLARLYLGGAAKSRELASRFQALAQGSGVGFFDAANVARVSPVDGVHLDLENHASLGRAMAGAIRDL